MEENELENYIDGMNERQRGSIQFLHNAIHSMYQYGIPPSMVAYLFLRITHDELLKDGLMLHVGSVKQYQEEQQ